MITSGAQAVIHCLESEGVEVVFGYPGGAILPVYDAMIDSPIKHVLVRQEQAAVHAASGYARVSGNVGVCMATSGPGATNLVTGIATAYMDSVPIVILTGQVATPMIGTDAFQEVDITGITQPIVKHNYLVKDASELPRILKEAFHIAATGRPGPVLVDIPKNISEAPCKAEIPSKVSLPGYKPTINGHPSQIKRACQLMAESERPIIHAGGGVISAKASKELVALAERLQAPVATTLMGLGAIPAGHALSMGMLGLHGFASANRAIMESDLIISIGVRFDDRVTSAVEKFAPQARIIHIDIDPAEIGKNVSVTVPIVGHVRVILKAINRQLEPMRHDAWLARARDLRQPVTAWYPKEDGSLTARTVLDRLSALTGGEAVVTTDVGQHQMFAAQFYRMQRPKSFLTSGGLGTMGYGLPAAVGAQMADTNATVICVTGDGSLQMSMAELATAREQNLPVKVLVFNNSCLGLVRQLQHFYCDGRYTAVHMTGNPDFVKLAAAYDICGYRITRPDQVGPVLTEALGNGKLSLIECVVSDEDLVYPMVLAGDGLDEMITGTEIK